jgi:hypothetical protein
VTSISPTAVDYSAELRRTKVTVTAPSDCHWNTTTTSPFISLGFNTSGAGNGSFTYTVFGNLTGASRSGSVSVSDQGVGVTQRAALGSSTFLSFVSDTGDFIGQGWTFLAESPASTFTVRSPLSNAIDVSFVTGEGFFWDLALAAPQGQQLRPGVFLNATRYPFQAPAVPGLSFSGDGRGCNVLSGQFTISNLVYGSDGSVQQLRADFEQHCEGAGAALRGTVSYVR